MSKLDGVFWVTEVTHHFDESGKYHNQFTCSPLDVSYPVKKHRPPRLTNLQSAIVTDIDDPDGLGRIKVKIPALDFETLWVRFAVPHAGNQHGWVILPEVDDEVLIGWENGDPDLPVVLGCLYNGKDTPMAKPGQDNEVKLFVTKAGNEIRFTDKDGEEQIKISTKDGKNQIVLDMKGPSISITSDGDISIKGGNVTIESQQQLQLKSGADTKIEAQANLTVKATGNVNSEAGAVNKIKGAIINLN
jgi:uncharacterized protein involved in type VI secretion and phage assembly